MSTHRLDITELHRRVNTRRRERDLSWREVARETRLSPSTLSRLTGTGRSIEADALVTLLVWLDMDADLAWVIAPADGRAACPGCGVEYQPTRSGGVRRHSCLGGAS